MFCEEFANYRSNQQVANGPSAQRYN